MGLKKQQPNQITLYVSIQEKNHRSFSPPQYPGAFYRAELLHGSDRIIMHTNPFDCADGVEDALQLAKNYLSNKRITGGIFAVRLYRLLDAVDFTETAFIDIDHRYREIHSSKLAYRPGSRDADSFAAACQQLVWNLKAPNILSLSKYSPCFYSAALQSTELTPEPNSFTVVPKPASAALTK